MLIAPLDEDGMERPVEVAAAGGIDRLDGAHRLDGLARPRRQAGAAQAAHEVHDVVGERAARFGFGLGRALSRRHGRSRWRTGAGARPLGLREAALVRQQALEVGPDRGRVELDAVELDDGARPRDHLAEPRHRGEIGAPHALDEGGDVVAQPLLDPRQAGAQDRLLLPGVGVIDPVVEAAPLERVVHLARAVRRDDDDGALRRGHRAHLGHAHLELGEHLQQVRLEGRVGPVDLVDQENGRAEGIGLERREQRPLDQEALAEDVLGQRVAPGPATLGQADRQHLRGVVPLVDGGRRVEPLVALQAEQPPAQRLGQGRGELRLAAAGLALQQQGRPSAKLR